MNDLILHKLKASCMPYGPTTSTSNANGNDVVMSSSNLSHCSPPLVVPQRGRYGSNKPTSVKTFPCQICDQVFDAKSDLLSHGQNVHKQNTKPYKCQICGSCFANSSYLSQHSRIHTGMKPFRCQICERKFTQLCHLQQHIRTHTGEKPYKCTHPGCGKNFSQLSNLQSHSRSHMKDKPFRCNSCYKCFSDEEGLAKHVPKHSDKMHKKTHVCKVCGKSYTQETYLSRHMTKHLYEPSGQNHATQEYPNISPVAQQMYNIELKPGFGSHGLMDNYNKQPAHMPTTYSFQTPSIFNNFGSSVPSNYTYASPGLPSTSLSSPLSHLSSVSSPRFYNVDAFGDCNQDRSMSNMSSMATNSLLSLHHIKDFMTQLFSKSNPNSQLENIVNHFNN